MSFRGIAIAFVACSTLVAALPMATSQETRSADDPEYYDVKLIGASTYYGGESWKLDPGLYGSDPEGGLMNGTSRYDGAVGLRVSLKVRLTDEQGKDVPTTDTELPFVNLSARIETPLGTIPAYVQRESGLGPTTGIPPAVTASPNFYLHFDVDGSDQVGAAGSGIPALLPGLQVVHVEIRKGTVPTSMVNAGNTDLVFSYVNPALDVEVSDLGGSFTSEVPDDLFRLFTDIGAGNTVRMVTEPVHTDTTVQATYIFGQPGATAHWYALAAERLCQPPACTSPERGSVQIHRRELPGSPAKTDANGSVTFSATGADLLRFNGRAFNSAIVVLAASLDPAADLGTDLSTDPTFALGSSRIATGAMEFVVPVSNAEVRVRGFNASTSAAEGTQDVPPPVREIALGLNALRVDIYDDGGGSTSGDAIAFVPDTEASQILAEGPVTPNTDATTAAKYRTAQLPVSDIQAAGITRYRVMSLLYSGSGDDFYGLAFADRGYSLVLNAPPTPVGSRGGFYMNLTSFNTNYDLRTQEPTFDLRVILEITVPDLQINETETFNLREGLSESRLFAISADRVADIRASVLATTGDTLTEQSTVMHFVEPKRERNFVDRLPGFEAVTLLAALMAIGWISRRRVA